MAGKQVRIERPLGCVISSVSLCGCTPSISDLASLTGTPYACTVAVLVHILDLVASGRSKILCVFNILVLEIGRGCYSIVVCGISKHFTEVIA